ncbi:MAG: EVE domain-containing protein [Candidatus Eisenbacteria bacterium]|uniref:EVE domain-containing protein n=1 Tax=Eiseniibacteriota bacterium TaxID=2212470 RepID=A0A956LXW4_UNCEI|nr:EVE domain-containing protein [Candidatus Eisenbacteria bacterium]
MAKRYWLFKSEPDVFSFDDLEKAKNQTTTWEGVRNYQARNMLRDDVQVGDEVFFYHSRVQPMHVAGIARVVRAGYPDPFQFDRKSKYHDEGASPDDPRWYTVDIQAHQRFSRPVTLEEMRETTGLEQMVLLRKGSRLSIQPVTAAEWKIVVGLGKKSASKERS